MTASYADNVFLNHPLDDGYLAIRNALIFAVHDCGFVARSALEATDASENRLDKIYGIIEESRFGIHDISRTELNDAGLPRFNMPFELGIFLGCKRFGRDAHGSKSCLVLDRERYRFHQFLSDLSGVDIESHRGNPGTAIRCVRDWLKASSRRETVPSAQSIRRRYAAFQRALPTILLEAEMERGEMTYFDYAGFVVDWLRINAR